MPDSTPTALRPQAAADEPPSVENGSRRNGGGPKAPKPKLKKLRLLLVLAGLALLALLSTMFGMLMAVASEIPSLENSAEFRTARNSTMLASDGAPIARLTGNENRILIDPEEISPNIKNAVIAIEDKRFYQHHGVDLKGMARAAFADVSHHGTVQGGSTITEQFVKNALAAQNNRTVFEKLREAALAYHLERQWSKQKILGEYLNTIYFGNGAYGVESAMRTYFGGPQTSYNPQERMASNASPDQAALLAGMIASPSGYNPVTNPTASLKRRNLVLGLMLQQHMISPGQYQQALIQALPGAQTINPPHPDSSQPYFSTWVTQQLVDKFGAGRVFGGALKVTTSIDPQLQAAAVQAINGGLAAVGPTASLVAIDNRTGEVKAMVGGNDFEHHPFNIATDGHRQPGSAFKPFTLIEALEQGISPSSVWPSAPVTFKVSKRENFPVHNFEDKYSGSISLANALAYSDNSVFARLGIQVGTHKIARLANRMGLKTKVSTNLAITLGGLKEGLNPLEMAYAYSTIANGGKRVTGSLPAWKNGPVAIETVKSGDGKRVIAKDKRRFIQVVPTAVAQEAIQLMHGVVTHGTGTKANIPNDFIAGKTGTTENYGDAWFVGFDSHYTVAVWVGYPDKLIPMKTLYQGGPVEGGTYPAIIWHSFMVSALNILNTRNPKKNPQHYTPGGAPSGATGLASPSPGTTAPSQTQGTGQGKKKQQDQQNQQPQDNGNGTGNQGTPAPDTGTPPTQQQQPSPGNNTGGAGTGGVGLGTGTGTGTPTPGQ
jgi:penicillin-binding protein 1A